MTISLVVGLCAVVGWLIWVTRRLAYISESYRAPDVDGLRTKLDYVETLSQHLEIQHDEHVQKTAGRFGDLTIAIDSGIKHVERAEARVRGVVTRAKRELADKGVEAPGLEAEMGELQLLDGDTVFEQGMQQLPPDVEVPEPSSIPGITADELRRARMMR